MHVKTFLMEYLTPESYFVLAFRFYYKGWRVHVDLHAHKEGSHAVPWVRVILKSPQCNQLVEHSSFLKY